MTFGYAETTRDVVIAEAIGQCLELVEVRSLAAPLNVDLGPAEAVTDDEIEALSGVVIEPRLGADEVEQIGEVITAHGDPGGCC